MRGLEDCDVVRRLGWMGVTALIATAMGGAVAEERPVVPDAAAHTVIVPYDASRPVEDQEAERYYLPYETFERLWELAKENRRPAGDADDDATMSGIQSVHYQCYVGTGVFTVTARIVVVTQGRWAALPLGIGVSGRVDAGLVEEVRIDGELAALEGGKLRVETPGRHEVSLSVFCPVPRDWKNLVLEFPASPAAWITVATPLADGWMRVNGKWAERCQELETLREFSHPIGAIRQVHLERSQRGLNRGNVLPPAASVRTSMDLPSLGPERFDTWLSYQFPGTHRRTLSFEIDPELKLLDLGMEGAVDPEIIRVLDKPGMNGLRRIEVEFEQEIRDSATLLIGGIRLVGEGEKQRQTPVIVPEAKSVAGAVRFYHRDTHELNVSKLATPYRGPMNLGPTTKGWLDGGAYQLSDPLNRVAYEILPADQKRSVTADYVFQLSEQKCELLAALAVSFQTEQRASLRVKLPEGYEVQSVTGPLLQRWQEAAGVLYLHLNAAGGGDGTEARLAVHLARTAEAAVSEWTLEPLVVEGFEKVKGTALIAAHAATEVRLPGFQRTATLDETDPGALDEVFAIAPPVERKRALAFEQAAWSVAASLSRAAPRFRAETVLLTGVSDAGVGLSQHVAVDVEQGAIRALRLSLPAELPEARITGALLRETRSAVEDGVRHYDCTFQTDVLDQTALVLSVDLPLTTELALPFVGVSDAEAVTRFFVIDNGSSRESGMVNPEAGEKVTREALPYLPKDLERPEFFRGVAEGPLKLTFSELNQTEGNAAIVTLAEITTVLRADGERWDTVKYSLLNRSLQFLPVVLPRGADLIAARVSGEVVRADEERRGEREVKLIPLIHTRPGERGIEVELTYRMRLGEEGPPDRLTLDDPELDGISVERTTWSVWTPEGWRVADQDGNMTAVDESAQVLNRKVAAVSMIKAVSQRLLSGDLSYDDANEALRATERWIEELGEDRAGVSRRSGGRDSSLYGNVDELNEELLQQKAILKDNRSQILDSGRVKTRELSRAQAGEGAETDWQFNGAPPPSSYSDPFANNDSKPAPLGIVSNVFAESWVQTDGAQVMNDNVAVANGFFYQGGTQVEMGKKLEDALQVDLKSAFNSNARGNQISQMRQAEMDQQNRERAAMEEAEVLRREQLKAQRMDRSSMSADPFSAAPPPPPAAAKAKPAAESNKPMYSDPFGTGPDELMTEAKVMTKSGATAEVDVLLPVLQVQSVESLRPTGRRSLDLEVPTEGTALHFTKLKDHAVIELELERAGGRWDAVSLWVFGLAGGAWLIAWWSGRQGRKG